MATNKPSKTTEKSASADFSRTGSKTNETRNGNGAQNNGNENGRNTTNSSNRNSTTDGKSGSQNGKSNSTSRGKNNAAQNRPSGEQEEGLRKLMMDQLKDIYWAEKALTKAIPKMIKQASSEELINALSTHLDETTGQVEKLEEVFQLLGEKASAKKCEAMEGLIKEATEIMEELEEGSVKDAGIICAGQKVEHYEMATYGCLKTYAEILGETEAASLFEEILDEEKNADVTLTEVAQAINWEAANEDENEEEDDEEGDTTATASKTKTKSSGNTAKK